MFSGEDPDRVRDRILELASADARVVAGAVVGSLANDDGDRWADLDLTFAVADGVAVVDVLDDWTRGLSASSTQFISRPSPRSQHLPRVPVPGCLQVDLSFTPACEFAAGGRSSGCCSAAPSKALRRAASAHELFGYAVHHALRARFASSVAATGRPSTG
jgi:hypothetical protein